MSMLVGKHQRARRKVRLDVIDCPPIDLVWAIIRGISERRLEPFDGPVTQVLPGSQHIKGKHQFVRFGMAHVALDSR